MVKRRNKSRGIIAQGMRGYNVHVGTPKRTIAIKNVSSFKKAKEEAKRMDRKYKPADWTGRLNHDNIKRNIKK